MIPTIKRKKNYWLVGMECENYNQINNYFQCQRKQQSIATRISGFIFSRTGLFLWMYSMHVGGKKNDSVIFLYDFYAPSLIMFLHFFIFVSLHSFNNKLE